jgi:hypothetical protein
MRFLVCSWHQNKASEYVNSQIVKTGGGILVGAAVSMIATSSPEAYLHTQKKAGENACEVNEQGKLLGNPDELVKAAQGQRKGSKK